MTISKLWIQNLKRTTAWLLLATTPLVMTSLVGCVKGGSLTSGSNTTATDGTLTIDKAYPTSAGSSWAPIQVSNRTYIKGADLTLSGTCSPGVAKIKVSDGGPAYAETATCDSNGNYVWSRSYTAASEADLTLTVAAYDVQDLAITGAKKSIDVRVDDVVPVSPTVTTPATTPYIANATTSDFNVIGTCSADTFQITFNSPTGPVITPTFSGGNCTGWNFHVTLVQGSTVTYKFYAHDLAGNISPVTNQVISWSPTITLRTTQIGAGAVIMDTGANYKMEASIITAHGTSSSNGIVLGSGFNYITKFARDQQ